MSSHKLNNLLRSIIEPPRVLVNPIQLELLWFLVYIFNNCVILVQRIFILIVVQIVVFCGKPFLLLIVCRL
ncbi:unnamed protein product [Leptidea sinapis]|uniref:Uncharacterized protein n=1 Tax=Leptidea sinapis TaxID=189913 RepID=A0A5E4QDC8_9NEOP|nr:unnamed protein product [Leptidea sinapis]